MRKLITLCLLSFASLSAFTLPEKIYLDMKEMDTTDDRFYIHLGDNVWVESSALYRDETGLFTLEQNILRSKNGMKSEVERKWKCPYCYKYWPVGTACQNKDCPSKYK